MEVIKKCFTELLKEERISLKMKCKKYGAMRQLLINYENGNLPHPEFMEVIMLVDDGKIVAWLLLDWAGNYDPKVGANEISVMIYVCPPFRGKGCAKRLLNSEVPNIKNLILVVYPDDDRASDIFFAFGLANDLKIRYEDPVFYFAEKRRKENG